MSRPLITTPSKVIKTLDEGMELDVDSEEESFSRLYSVSISPKEEESKLLVDAAVLMKIMETLERLNRQVEDIQARVEEKITQSGKIRKVSDPRPGRRGPRRGVVRAKGLNGFREAVRNYACERLGLARILHPCDWPIAEPGQVKDYNSRNPSKSCRGPDAECIRIDWADKGATNWTRDCAAIFASDMWARKQNGDFSWIGYPFTEDEVAEAFKQYILPLKRRYQREVADPMLAAEHQAVVRKRSRSFSRKKQLLGRRLAMIKHHNLPESAAKLVEALDVEGISSEESEGEIGSQRSFKVKTLPWRSLQLTTWLHRIDELPTKNSLGAVIPKRMAFRRRQASDLTSEDRPPVPKLHRNLYDTNWLQKRPHRFTKQLCIDEEFVFPPLDRCRQ